MSGTNRNGRHELTPEQQQMVDDGLRILARMIVRRFQQDGMRAAGRDEGDGQEGVGS